MYHVIKDGIEYKSFATVEMAKSYIDELKKTACDSEFSIRVDVNPEGTLEDKNATQSLVEMVNEIPNTVVLDKK